MKQSKTEGLEWLSLSMSSFNGSGYADKATPENYVASYTAYKTWKRDRRALRLLADYPDVAYSLACRLVLARDAGHTPSDERLATFRQYYEPDRVGLL